MIMIHAQANTNEDKRQSLPLVISPKEALDLFGGKIGRNTLYRALRRGELPSRRVGKKILMRSDVLLDWLAGSTEQEVR
jgi:excisionase family DNA binding protein